MPAGWLLVLCRSRRVLLRAAMRGSLQVRAAAVKSNSLPVLWTLSTRYWRLCWQPRHNSRHQNRQRQLQPRRRPRPLHRRPLNVGHQLNSWTPNPTEINRHRPRSRSSRWSTIRINRPPGHPEWRTRQMSVTGGVVQEGVLTTVVYLRRLIKIRRTIEGSSQSVMMIVMPTWGVSTSSTSHRGSQATTTAPGALAAAASSGTRCQTTVPSTRRGSVDAKTSVMPARGFLDVRLPTTPTSWIDVASPPRVRCQLLVATPTPPRPLGSTPPRNWVAIIEICVRQTFDVLQPTAVRPTTGQVPERRPTAQQSGREIGVLTTTRGPRTTSRLVQLTVPRTTEELCHSWRPALLLTLSGTIIQSRML